MTSYHEGHEGHEMKSLYNRRAVTLLQLPIPEVHSLYTGGNIPLAAGYLKAFALHSGVVSNDDITILPREIANNAGDAAILKWVIEENPDVVGFTSYMWNIGRNLVLARKIKKQKPDIRIILGGPEINPGHWALESRHIDSFFLGEGEQAFVDFLRDREEGKPLKRIYQTRGPVDLKTVPNPYLKKVLVPYEKEPMFLETMRGCPYLCKYCFYSKSFAALRFFPGEHLAELFALARDHGVPEIYLMDPSFNVTPGLKEKLEHIKTLNPTRIPIHTEIRLESVTPGIARLMKDAGFASVEAGLQSINTKSLAAIGRNWNRERFIRGAGLLQEPGIDIKTGVILGLPYDTMEDFGLTLDFVRDLNLEESMEIYPLSLIPGTQLRDEATMLGMTYMKHPPYWVLSTEYMGQKDIKRTIEMVEHKLEIEFFPPIIPRFENVYPDYIHFLDLRENAAPQLGALQRHPERVSGSLTVLMNEKTGIHRMEALGRALLRDNACTLVQLVIDRDTIPPEDDVRRLIDVFYHPNHYFNHIHHYKIDTQGRSSLRLFHLTADLEMAESYHHHPYPYDLVLRYSPELLERGRDILEEKPILLVDSPIKKRQVDELKQIYHGFENFLIFKRKKSYKIK